MTSRFISGERSVWTAIKSAAQSRGRADVAVAYFGTGGAKLLPLQQGSRLVVDVSEGTVKAGATSPAELLTLVKQGVQVFSRPALHAKVFVFSRRAIIGSANVSGRSEKMLTEAALATTDTAIVQQARQFVQSLAVGVPMGPEELQRLSRLYKPPSVRTLGGKAAKQKRKTTRYFYDGFQTEDVPEGAEQTEKAVYREGLLRRLKRTHLCYTLWYGGKPQYREGDVVFFVEDDDNGNEMMSPPARVLTERQWSNGSTSYTFHAFEQRDQRRAATMSIAEKLGRGWKTTFSRFGKLNTEEGQRLSDWWNERN